MIRQRYTYSFQGAGEKLYAQNSFIISDSVLYFLPEFLPIANLNLYKSKMGSINHFEDLSKSESTSVTSKLFKTVDKCKSK